MNTIVGQPAPVFELPNQDGSIIRMEDYLGQMPVVLFFYPGDFTYGCTREACAFRDIYTYFSGAGIKVFGISHDSVTTHKKFRDAYDLPYDLLSDPAGKVAKLYKIGRFLFLRDRATVIIDKDGRVVKVYKSQIHFSKHAHEALKILKGIN